MAGDRFDDYRDPDGCDARVSLLLFSLVALIAWLLFAGCVESAQTVIP